MTGRLAMPTLIALCSIALAKPTVSSLAVLGEISISGTLIKVDELANTLQICLDSGAKKVLLHITSAADLGTVPAELIGSFMDILEIGNHLSGKKETNIPEYWKPFESAIRS